MIEYSAARELSINHQPVLMADLETTLQSVFDARVDKTLFITASASLKYGDASRSSMRRKARAFSASAS